MKKKFAVILILVGIIFISIPKISEFFLLKNNEEVKIDSLSDKDLEKNANSGEKEFDASKIQAIDVNGVILNREKADMDKVVGQLVIPSINMNIAIFDGLQNNNLMYGACTMKPDQKMGLGNYAVAGHYFKKDGILFGSLMKVKEGDTIKLTNKKNIYEYEAVKTRKVKDDRTDLIKDDFVERVDGKAMVSLMTCYYDEEGYRYFVFGRFKKLYPYSKEKMLDGITSEQ
ncbi:class A sortase [Peptostreptococcus faecalis]|uniref:class A sortase n=1 Tax=Peptostreptococcus faecalis TaxID=2045015 RepID=UPI000C7ADFB2|nr:class A sortase [Peptostreptococcus faecalis]